MMTVQNRLYTIKFSHHSTTDSQPVHQQWWRNLEFMYFKNFAELPKKTKLLKKKD